MAYEFNIGKDQYRVIGEYRQELERGYSEPATNKYSLLQRKVFSFFSFEYWKTVEEELVPSFAWISQATVGWTDWESALIARYKPLMKQRGLPA